MKNKNPFIGSPDYTFGNNFDKLFQSTESLSDFLANNPEDLIYMLFGTPDGNYATLENKVTDPNFMYHGVNRSPENPYTNYPDFLDQQLEQLNKDIELTNKNLKNKFKKESKEDSQTGAIKYDSDKLKWNLLPLEPIEQLVKVLTFGAKKYGAEQWKKMEDKDRYYAAMMRHIAAWRNGEPNDPETGLHHLTHAMTNNMFLLYFILKDEGKDGNRK